MRRRAVLIAAAVAAVIAVTIMARPFVLLWADELLAHRAQLLAAATMAPVLSAAAFVAVFVLATSLALPVGGLMALLSGYLFGPCAGAGLVVLGGTTSALVVYGAARTALSRLVQERATPAIRRAIAGIERHGFWCLLCLRLVPVVPAFALNLAAGSIGFRLRAFIVATALGKFPGALLYAMLGAGLGSASSVQDLVKPQIAVALTGLALLAVSPAAFALMRRRWGATGRRRGAAAPIPSREALRTAG